MVKFSLKEPEQRCPETRRDMILPVMKQGIGFLKCSWHGAGIR